MIVASHQKRLKITTNVPWTQAAMLAYTYDIDLPNDIIVPTLITIAEHDDGMPKPKKIKTH
jgi:hypothetical protein